MPPTYTMVFKALMTVEGIGKSIAPDMDFLAEAQPFVAVDDGEVDPFASRLAPRYFNLRKASIYAGSNEIQRNIIAKMTLGL